MRKASLAVLSAVAVLVVASAALASKPIKLIVNGREVDTDVPPSIVNGRTMVPIRWVVEALGAEVQWEEKETERIVTVTVEDKIRGLLQRLRAIEPEQAFRIRDDHDSEQVKQFVSNNQLKTITDIRSLGTKVPFQVTSEDDEWCRPAYSEAWHTTFMDGKYSDVAALVNYARRRLFVYTGGLSEGAGLYYRLGFGEDWTRRVGGPFDPAQSFEIWLINARAKEIFRSGDEYLVVIEPRLQGYQTVRLSCEVKEPEGRLMLFRAVTPDGYELERTARRLPGQ